jgi:hypothetical protein
MRRFVIVMAILGFAHSAHAHGIAGNRFFPGTLSFDDPAVADESILPLFSSSKHPDEGGDVVDNRFTWSFFRLLTPTLGIGVDSGWVHRDWGSSRSSGFDTTNLTIKGEVYRNDLHETLVSAGLAWGIGHSGAQGAGANAPDLIAPGIFFGKGFGDLPASLAWLRPFGITGALTLEHPMTGMSTTSGIDPLTGQLGSILMPDVDTLHWGFAIEFSTLYLTNRFTPGKLPKEEPLNQLVPLVEFSFVSARGQKTVATMNPGLSYVAVSWQVAAEAIVPLNSEAGRSIGARAQLLLFLDELIPSLFGKPLLSRCNSQKYWVAYQDWLGSSLPAPMHGLRISNGLICNRWLTRWDNLHLGRAVPPGEDFCGLARHSRGLVSPEIIELDCPNRGWGLALLGFRFAVCARQRPLSFCRREGPPLGLC